MDVDDPIDRRLKEQLSSGLASAPPIERLIDHVERMRSRRRTTAIVASVAFVVAGVGTVATLLGEPDDTLNVRPAETSTPEDGTADREPRPARQVKAEILDALGATAPAMLTVTSREDDTTDLGQHAELGAWVLWDFADPGQYDLTTPPAGVDEWVNGDPGGGLRATATVTVTPGFDPDEVEMGAFDPTGTACGTCDFTGYHEIPNSGVQWFVIKDDVQISVSSERPEVWPEMRAWLDRFAAELDEIDTRSLPARSDADFPTGAISMLRVDPMGAESQLVALSTGRIDVDPTTATITAVVGCRVLTGRYAVERDRLVVSDPAVDRTATCELDELGLSEEAAASAADAVFDVLRSNPIWVRRNGTKLALTGADAALSGTIGTP